MELTARRARPTQGKTMPARTIFNWAILSVALTACGCGSTGVVTRAQSAHAHPPAPGQFQNYRSPSDQARDHLFGERTSYHTDDSGMVQQANCRQGGGNCPQQGGNCPPEDCYQTRHGYDGVCPHGVRGGCPSCGPGCGRTADWVPTHHKTYSYSVPKDLSYPEQNAVGGAIVYPYYTHKGPSDFFRQK